MSHPRPKTTRTAAPRTAAPRGARRSARRRRVRAFVRGVLVVAAVVGLAAAWVWHRTLPLEAVEVTGTLRAQPADVARLAGVAPDSTAPVSLYGVDIALVADRVRRHPWVREARVSRLPSGTMRIRVEERTPAVLVVGADGAPAHFLDAAGFAMPLPAGPDAADVPLLRGAVPAYHPTQPVGSRPLRRLLAALAAAPPEVDALVAEVRWSRAGATVLTPPAGGHAPIPVRLGRAGFDARLARLGAFWTQAVLPRPETPFRLVDLRFDGQVVTREGASQTAPESSAPQSAAPAAPDSLTPPSAPPPADPSLLR